MTVTIRPAVTADLPVIAEIYGHYVRTTTITWDEQVPTLAEWQHKLDAVAGSGWPFSVATAEDGTVLGYALLAPFRGKSGWRYTAENSIYLAPEATGRGVGRLLLDELIEAGTTAGVRAIVAVITDEGTEASVALHTKAGFEPSGVFPSVGWKFDRALGVRMMTKHLGIAER